MSNGISFANRSLQRESETEYCPAPRSLEMCVSSFSPVQPQSIEDLRTWLRQVSPASRSALQAGSAGETTAATCGRQQSNVSAWYDRDTHCWRTYQDCLLPGISAQSWEIWPKAGMTHGGEFYPQPSWERRISEIGCGLWPTMRASLRGAITPNRVNDKFNNLESVLARQMWPTPTVFDATGAQRSPEAMERAQAGRAIPGRNGGAPKNLREEVVRFPTPAQRDWRSGSGRQENGHTPQLPEVIGGQLNPDWVEWLMGWPIGWSDLKPLGMDRFRQWSGQHGCC